MPGIEEIRGNSQLAASVRDAIEQLGLVAEDVVFTAYTRVVLPLDGYVFWSPTVIVKAKGVVHFSQHLEQNETETYGHAVVTFTSEGRLVQFDALGNHTLLVARIGGFRYAFSSQGGFQDEARLWHYQGDSILPELEAQLLDPPRTIDPSQAVVSNSLPAWLALNGWSTPFEDWFSNAPVSQGGLGITLYPSFLVRPNIPPPYGVVHIGAEDTSAQQAVPFVDSNRSSWQLASDRVRITLYGLQNNAAVDFLNCVLQYIEYTGNFGLQNMPIVRDGKRWQTEVQAIAMQKVIDFTVSYNQARMASVARTLIEQASAQIQINPSALSS
jgi:hypothetical protein